MHDLSERLQERRPHLCDGDPIHGPDAMLAAMPPATRTLRAFIHDANLLLVAAHHIGIHAPAEQRDLWDTEGRRGMG